MSTQRIRSLLITIFIFLSFFLCPSFLPQTFQIHAKDRDLIIRPQHKGVIVKPGRIQNFEITFVNPNQRKVALYAVAAKAAEHHGFTRGNLYYLHTSFNLYLYQM